MDIRHIVVALREHQKAAGKILQEPCHPRHATKRININQQRLLIQGVRGSGKTHTTLHALHAIGANAAYIDLGDISLHALSESDSQRLAESVRMVYGSGIDCLVADECTSIACWETLLEAFSAEGIKTVAIASGLALGDCKRDDDALITFYPLSFSEYCIWHGIDVSSDAPQRAERLRTAFAEYLRQGGFPALQDKKRVKAAAAKIIDTIIDTDILPCVRKSMADELDSIARLLIANTATWINYRTVAEQQGMRSEITVKKYIEIIKRSGLLYDLKRFAMMEKQRNVFETLYAADPALVADDLQRKLETVTFMQLRRFCERHGYAMHYYANRSAECNFALCVNRKMRTIIQVIADYGEASAVKEKVAGLIAMTKATGSERLYIITDDAHDTIDVKGMHISVVPAYEFLSAHTHLIV